ncbi:MAG: hypothetical protein M9894_32655 [Planctomycetes bacterium]|nr:hypothetical protein [Planctomycetota bacterium]
MNRIRGYVCDHPRLRAVDYDDEAFQWEVTCADCGRRSTLSQAEWRLWQRAHAPARPAALVVGHDVAESGRAPRV